MGRSQRHKVIQQNASSEGYIFDEGGYAPAALKQAGGPYAVPIGAAGGPLSGSPLMGPIPIGFVAPTPHEGAMAQLPAPSGQQPAGGERTFPIGPFSFLRIEPVEGGGGSYVLEQGADIRPGDTVRIEATGTSAANGDYVVQSVATANGELTLVAPSEVAGEIVAKGRVTVIAGAA